jgi:predicted metal-dependent phosphoesterase TrpH
MNRGRAVTGVLLVAAVVAGTIADRPAPRPPLTLGGYRVLAVDFHTHTSMWSDGSLTPWGLVLEADHQGLDAIAITGHDQTIGAHVGHWYQRTFGGPIVLVGDEVLGDNGFHITAAGINDTIRYRRSGGTAIDEIHRQGGIAIVAHPFSDFWPAYDTKKLHGLDGAEICHPEIYAFDEGQSQLEQFAGRAPVAAVGSSDFHGIGVMGLCRTYVFAETASEQAILDAVRAHRTVVFGKDGRVYGDPALLPFADRLRDRAPASNSRGGPLDWVSRIAGIGALGGLLFL